ncbi:MAG TPA: GNAT family N-acetyltransferase, partial [Ramlibacter sp.]
MSATVATFGVPGEADWAELLRRGTPNVFLHPAALAAATNAGLAPLRVLQAWHGDSPRRLVGLWAVQQSRTTPLGPAGLATPPYEYAFLSNPVIDPEFMHEAVDAFLDLIASDAQLPSVLRLRYLDADCPSYLALLGAIAARGARWMEVSRRARPFVTRTSGRKLQGATHGKLRQKWNRLCAAGPVEVRNDRAPAAVREAFETYLALEAASWKGERGTAMLSNPDHARFTRHLIAGLAEDGSASVALLTVGGRAIAAQVVLRCASTAYTWKTAYDAAYGDFSPGALLVDKVTEQLFATDDIQQIESCSPEGGFMDRMWNGRRATVDLVADLGSARSLPFSVAALGARSYAQLRAVHHAMRDPSWSAMSRWVAGATSSHEHVAAPAMAAKTADNPRAPGGSAVAIAVHADTVVCSPHFDDAVLCCWSVLDRDKDCAVVNVFTGAPDAGFTSWIDQLNGAST